MNNLLPELMLPIILYAETHYKFKGIYSRLFQREPEIIVDAPFRIEPGQAIPILLLIKDAHRFPVEIQSLQIEIKQAAQLIGSHSIELNLLLDKARCWHRIFYLERPSDVFGSVTIDVQFIAKINGTIKKYHNDNYRISSHQPLQVYLAKDPLPRFDDWYFGDFHYHSNYTEDQVEFGAPLKATVEMARAIGLNFFAVTDHSYDLDDQEDSWTENDHRLAKWHRFKAEVERLNHKLTDFVILPGEEVSAGNHRNRNVHLLIVNHPNFFPGKGDSAERWFRTRPDLSIPQILEQLDNQALAIAGHPEMPTPLLQWLLIRRGRWQLPDLQHPRLDGFQSWNGGYDQSFHRCSSNWVKLLLEGRRLSLIAGNDAHGNFNRFRQIGFPFFTFRENESQLFGNMRTGVRIVGNFAQQNIVDAVKANRVMVTNGPIIELSIRNEQGRIAQIGDEIFGNELLLSIAAKSTDEFGKLVSIQLWEGDVVNRNEVAELVVNNFNDPFHFRREQKLIGLSKACYIRAELTVKKDDGQIARCLTNPIWIKRNS